MFRLKIDKIYVNLTVPGIVLRHDACDRNVGLGSAQKLPNVGHFCTSRLIVG